MATESKKLNPVNEVPTTVNQLTKDYMLGYIKSHGNSDDKQWFKKLINENQKEKKNNLTKEIILGLDIINIRKEFAKRFFPNLVNNTNKKKKSSVASFIDEVNSL